MPILHSARCVYAKKTRNSGQQKATRQPDPVAMSCDIFCRTGPSSLLKKKKKKTRAHARTHTHAYTGNHTRTKYIHTQSRTSQARMHSTHTHTHARARAHTHTHTHTHTRIMRLAERKVPEARRWEDVFYDCFCRIKGRSPSWTISISSLRSQTLRWDCSIEAVAKKRKQRERERERAGQPCSQTIRSAVKQQICPSVNTFILKVICPAISWAI